MKTEQSKYIWQLECGIEQLTNSILPRWNIYRDAKYSHWDYHQVYLDREINVMNHSDVAILLGLLIVVYLFDLLFSWQVVEYIAKQQFQNSFLIQIALLVFPLGWITIEFIVNDFTHRAKQELDDFPRDRYRRRTWILWLVLSIFLATIIPLLYLATAINTMTNIVFTILAIGITFMAAIVHIVVIFSGTKMANAKQEFIFWRQHRHTFRNLQQQYRKLTPQIIEIQGIYTDYLRIIEEIYAEGGEYQAIILPALIHYIVHYIHNDYHHLPPGQEPQFNPENPPQLSYNHP